MERTQSDFEYFSKSIIDTVRRISRRDFDIIGVIFWGEDGSPDFQAWFDAISMAKADSEPVTCKPWLSDPEEIYITPTAHQMCLEIVARMYVVLFPERRRFIWSARTRSEGIDAAERYIETREAYYGRQADSFCDCLNAMEWQRIASDAERERLTLNRLALQQSNIDSGRNPPAPPREYSKPFRVGTWHQQFKDAKYSENESERYFRNWVADQIASKNATRDSQKGPICFDLAFLKTHGVTLPE